MLRHLPRGHPIAAIRNRGSWVIERLPAFGGKAELTQHFVYCVEQRKLQAVFRNRSSFETYLCSGRKHELGPGYRQALVKICLFRLLLQILPARVNCPGIAGEFKA